MELAVSAARATASSGPTIDVLAFPPDQAELKRWRLRDSKRWLEWERRARVALFLSIGMFLAWAADVGATFEIGHAGGSTLFGVASLPLALAVVLAYLCGQWALGRAERGLAVVEARYDEVTVRQAAPLLVLARENAVIAQYLRCVGRQQRALRNLERIALHAWIEDGRVDGTTPLDRAVH